MYKYNSYNSNLLDPNIQSPFFEDQQNNIWFTTYQALHIYDRSIDDFRYYQMISATGDTINEDYKAVGLNNNNLLLRAGEEMFLFDVETEKTIQAFRINTSAYNNEACIYRDSTMICGFVDSEGMTVLSCDISQGTIDTAYIRKGHFRKIEKWEDSFIVSDNEDRLLSLNTKGNLFQDMNMAFNGINDLFNYNDSLLFILTDNEIVQKEFSDIREPGISYPLPAKGNPITAYVDDLMNLFVSIDGKGVYFFNLNKQKFKHFQLEQNGIVANARGLIQDSQGKYWYTSRDNGIGIFNKDGTLLDSYNKYNGKCPHNLVFNLCFTEQNDIWGASGYDIIKYDQNSNRFKSIPLSHKKKFYFMIKEFSNGRILTIANNTDDIHEIVKNGDDYSLKQIYLDPPSNTYLVDAIEDSHGNILVNINAQRIGIYHFEHDTLKLQHTIDINSSLRWVWETGEENEYYISTTSGLYHFPNGLKESYNKIDDDKNRLSQTVYCVLGHEEDLWLSTNSGLFRYNTVASSLHQFSLADGVQGMEFNTTGGMIDKNGNFLFGGTNGINMFDPSTIELSDYNAPIHLSNIRINDEDWITETNISLTDKIVQDYTHNTFTFIFNGIDYSDPEAVRLRYQMENEDDHWVYLEKNDGLSRYSNLEPGQYVFKMQASNSDGIWSDHIRTIDIEVLPPFWQTLWFRLFAVLLLSGLTWFAFRSYYRRKIRLKDLALREQRLEMEKQSALQEERNRIAAEMHDDLGGGLTTINFISQKAMRKIGEGPEKDLLNKIVSQSNILVTNMSEIIWAMNSKFDSVVNLQAYIRRYTHQYLDDHDIDVNFKSDNEVPHIEISGKKRRHIFLVVKEALHNIVKHADANLVDVEISLDGNLLAIKVSDNGIGFKPKPGSTGNGLENMKSRIEEIEGKFRIYSENGTHLEFQLPVSIT